MMSESISRMDGVIVRSYFATGVQTSVPGEELMALMLSVSRGRGTRVEWFVRIMDN